MKFMQIVSAATLAGILATATGAAKADEVWNWSYAGGSVQASGQFDITGDGSTPSAVQWINGTYSDGTIVGGTIDGLVPLGTDANFLYDNQFGGTPSVSLGGILFDVNAGAAHVNLYYDAGSYQSVSVYDGVRITPVTFTAAPVPEPANSLLLLAGLGALGFMSLRRRSQG